MKKLIPVLFVIGYIGSASAAQVIQYASIADVAQHIEVQFTYNPNNGNLYGWERHLQPTIFNPKWNWRYCFLYYVTPNPMLNTSQFPISNVYNGTVSSPTNPKNSACWFTTNAINLDQAGYDWCCG